MPLQFGVTAPSVILNQYESDFNALDIFFTQTKVSGSLTVTVLEDTNNTFSSRQLFIDQISIIVSRISLAHMKRFRNTGHSKIEIF